MNDNDSTNDEAERIDTLEQRLNTLEAENRELKTMLEQHDDSHHSAITRRQTLAGLVGGGTLLGAAGATRAQPSDSDTDRRSPSSAPWNDGDSDGLLEPDDGLDGIDVNIVKSAPPKTEPDIGIVPKELITQNDRTIHVAPSGDDTNDGSKDAPVATIQEAVNRIPLFVLHTLTIDIADGTYNSSKESPAVHLGPVIVKGEGDLNLVGNTADPSAVHCDVGINWTAFGKLEHMRVHGIHWDFLSQFAGQADVRDCIFRGNGTAAISGKNGYAFFKRCDIGDPANDTYGVWGIQLERMYFDDCTIGATEAALNVFNGDIYQLSGGNTINAPQTFTMSGGAIATQGTDLYVGGEKIGSG
jgi:hypothetical protein